jgi:hypothetical protein
MNKITLSGRYIEKGGQDWFFVLKRSILRITPTNTQSEGLKKLRITYGNLRA